MNHLVRTIALWVFLLLALPAHADLEARVDDTRIDSMQTVQLQLRVTGTNDIDALDLSPLEKDFEIQGTSQQSQLRMINGQVSSWVDLQITLRPKTTGTLTIPRLEIAGQRSQPIEIEVRAIDPELQSRIDRLVYFDIELDRSEVYVQAQLLYTRRLYYTSGVQIFGDLPGAPEVADAVVLTLGETSQNITMRGDTRYGVLEQRYAIFPERSGKLTIPGFTIASSIVLPDGRRGIRVPAPVKTIDVLPIPAGYPPAATWLPARAVELRDEWAPALNPEGHPEGPASIRAGETLRRTITVAVTGNTGSAIPPLNTELRSNLIRQYPAAPQLEDDLFGTHVTGRRTQAEDVVPTWGGDLTAPALELPWWDTESRTLRVARLPAYPLHLIGETPPAGTEPAASVETPAELNPQADTDRDASPSATESTLSQRVRALVDRLTGTSVTGLQLAIAVAIILPLIALILLGGRKLRSPAGNAAVRRALQDAIRRRDPAGIREALTRAAMQGLRLPRHQIPAAMNRDPEWRRLHEELGRLLYRKDTESVREPASLEQCARARQTGQRLLRPARTAVVERNVLPPLYSP